MLSGDASREVALSVLFCTIIYGLLRIGAKSYDLKRTFKYIVTQTSHKDFR